MTSVADVASYTVIEVLRPGLTWRATDEAGNPVILKRLDPSCLQHGRLHPNVKERLTRIRELPLRDLAVLHGVEVIDGQPTLVWDDLPGETLEQFLSHGSTPALPRDIALLIASLHGHGIAHGAIHGRNIIVDASGRLRLTHFSPLLHYDLAVDEIDLAAMLGKLGLNVDSQTMAETNKNPDPRRTYANASFWLAILLAAIALAAAVMIYRAERSSSPNRSPVREEQTNRQ